MLPFLYITFVLSGNTRPSKETLLVVLFGLYLWFLIVFVKFVPEEYVPKIYALIVKLLWMSVTDLMFLIPGLLFNLIRTVLSALYYAVWVVGIAGSYAVIVDATVYTYTTIVHVVSTVLNNLFWTYMTIVNAINDF